MKERKKEERHKERKKKAHKLLLHRPVSVINVKPFGSGDVCILSFQLQVIRSAPSVPSVVMRLTESTVSRVVIRSMESTVYIVLPLSRLQDCLLRLLSSAEIVNCIYRSIFNIVFGRLFIQ